MQLPFFKRNRQKQDAFFGLFLKEQEGVGILMEKRNSKLALIEEEKFTYTNGWNNLAEDVDQVILKLEQKENVTIQDAIFFLYSHLVDDKSKEVKKEYFGKIKELEKK